MTSPPVTDETFDHHQLEHDGTGQPWDVLYFNLHGLAGEPFWYNGRQGTALSANTVLEANLTGITVFAENCFAQGPMAEAFLAAGAKAFVGGQVEQKGNFWRLVGAGRLGYEWLKAYDERRDAEAALSIALMRLPPGEISAEPGLRSFRALA